MDEQPAMPLEFSQTLVFPASALARLAPEGAEDHLLRADIRSDDMVLSLDYPVRGPSELGDVIQLVVDGSLIGSSIDLTPYDVGDTIPLTLRATDRPYDPIVDRRLVSINYRVTYYSGSGLSEYGPPGQQFITDILSPGRGSLAALEFSRDVRDKGVIPETLTTDPVSGERYLAATVKGYTDQSSGDHIKGWIDGLYFTPIAEVDEGLIGADIELRFSEAMLRALDGSVRQFSYRVEDRAGNVSILATTIDLPIEIEPKLIELDPLRVPGADDGLITAEDADVLGGVYVEVPGHTGIQGGDQIVVSWNAYAYGPFTVAPGDAGNDPVLARPVPYADVYADWLAGAGDTDRNVEAVASYRIDRAGRPFGAPLLPARVLVNLYGPGGEDPDPDKPWHGALGRPVVHARAGAGPVNLIPADALDEDALCIVPGMRAVPPDGAALKAGDRVRLYWNDEQVGGEQTVTVDGADRSFDVPAALLQRYSPGTWDVYYIVRRPLATPPFENRARSPAQPVVVKDITDLPGGGKLLKATWLAAIRHKPPQQIDYDDVVRDDGTFVRIHLYDNAAVDDRLDWQFLGYRTTTPGADPIEGTRHVESYVLVSDDLIPKEDDSVVPPGKTRFVDVHVPRNKFEPEDDDPIDYGSATFDYSATNDAGKAVAVQAWTYVAMRHSATRVSPENSRRPGWWHRLWRLFKRDA